MNLNVTQLIYLSKIIIYFLINFFLIINQIHEKQFIAFFYWFLFNFWKIFWFFLNLLFNSNTNKLLTCFGIYTMDIFIYGFLLLINTGNIKNILFLLRENKRFKFYKILEKLIILLILSFILLIYLNKKIIFSQDFLKQFIYNSYVFYGSNNYDNFIIFASFLFLGTNFIILNELNSYMKNKLILILNNIWFIIPVLLKYNKPIYFKFFDLIFLFETVLIFIFYNQMKRIYYRINTIYSIVE